MGTRNSLASASEHAAVWPHRWVTTLWRGRGAGAALISESEGLWAVLADSLELGAGSLRRRQTLPSSTGAGACQKKKKQTLRGSRPRPYTGHESAREGSGYGRLVRQSGASP